MSSGVEHEPVKDIGPAYILEFRDPDNIALELTAAEVAAGGSFFALMGSADGGANRLPRRPPRNVRTATRHQVVSRPT